VTPDLNVMNGTLVLPWWVAAAAAAVIVFLCVFAARRAGWSRTISTLAQSAVVLMALALAWTLLDRLAMSDRADERRALEARVAALTSSVIAPGSPLACLDGAAGEMVIEACEKALFATPEMVAAAVAYVGARLTLLADGVDFSNRGDGSYDQALTELRRAAERDRYGFVAHVLAKRDNCTADKCEAFGLLTDPSWVISNLKDRTFDIHAARHAANWKVIPPVAAGSAPDATASVTAPGRTFPGMPARPNFDFPSATSIPPVNIMNNEPGMTGQGGVEAPKAEGKSDAKPATARRSNAKPDRRSSQNSPAPAETAPTPAPGSAATPDRAQ
jgi:hypothetical protein